MPRTVTSDVGVTLSKSLVTAAIDTCGNDGLAVQASLIVATGMAIGLNASFATAEARKFYIERSLAKAHESMREAALHIISVYEADEAARTRKAATQ